MEPQFSDTQRAAAIDLLESLPWGDVQQELYGLEVTLTLALEAVRDSIELWEAEGEERFGDEFMLSAEHVASLDAEWRLAYVARLLRTAAHAYGVPSAGTPGRNLEGEVTMPATWLEEAGSIASLIRGLNDIRHGAPSH